MSGGEFLAGLLSGLSDAYREASQERRRIELTKKQLEQQNTIAQAQLALAKSSQEMQHTIAGRQLDIEEKLGGRRLDVTERGQNIEAGIAANRDRLNFLSQRLSEESARGNIQEEGRIRKEITQLQGVINSMENDREADRKVSVTRQLTTLNEESAKRLSEHELGLKKEFATFTTESERAAAREKIQEDTAAKLTFFMIDRAGASADDARQVSAKMRETVAAGYAQSKETGDRVLAYYKTLNQEADDAKASGQLTEALVRGTQILSMKDPAQRVMMIAQIGGAEMDFSGVGQAGAPPGKIDFRPKAKTPPPTPASDPTENPKNREPASLDDDDLVQILKDNPEFAQKYGKHLLDLGRTNAAYMLGGGIGKKNRAWLSAAIEEAPGATVGERLGAIQQEIEKGKAPIKVEPPKAKTVEWKYVESGG